jgi:alpha-amylase/alpha-mannosidase (GH57 family)
MSSKDSAPVELATRPVELTPPQRFLCIHAHFYQPPRENPWLEKIERQPTASPWHDWNERITAECYGPNTAARIVNTDNEILDIRNNYEKISFNFGPTLLSWMEQASPEIYEEILAADARSARARNGHGNAIAQVYNHAIMPLCSARDKATQVRWGLEDFRSRFHRDPEGMWLAEAAVDVDTLEELAASGIRYTVLAPRQARSWRAVEGTRGWRATDAAGIDPSRAYTCPLPSGRSIVLFFYDGPISQAVAFEHLLINGDNFANRLLSGFSRQRPWNQLVHIATDGETYGHHHRHGEMALAYALHVLESRHRVRLTNYGEFLELNPPRCEVQVWDNSSWSCVHGVERWRNDCGCSTGGNAGWNQKWRRPLRQAFDVIRAKADALFEEAGAGLFRDPWEARNDYISVVLDRSRTAVQRFLARHLAVEATAEAEREALRLLELQRHGMLMYTSCAWFFDDVSGIEPVQTMRYAARLLQLLGPQAASSVEPEFLSLLERAPSNAPDWGNGRRVYEREARPMVVDLPRFAANYAMRSFDSLREGSPFQDGHFEILEEQGAISTYADCQIKLVRITLVSLLSGERLDATVLVLHLGGHDFHCRLMVPPFGAADHELLKGELFASFSQRSLVEVIRVVDRFFAGRDYSLADMFAEDQRELLGRITAGSFERFESSLVLMYDENRKLMEYLIEIGAPLPQGFLAIAEYVLRSRLIDELRGFVDRPETSLMMDVARQANRFGLRVVDARVQLAIAEALEQVFHQLALMPTGGLCRIANQLLDVVELMRVPLDLWDAQNICYALVHGKSLPQTLAKQTRYTRRPNQPVFPALRELGRRLKISPVPLAGDDDEPDAGRNDHAETPPSDGASSLTAVT